ncbi:MAG: hypothetical protein GY797_02310 [Deltaproteobacteria bacterium]|nr:hypothetical protein [Deltaproteobacteria bacterium]
MIYKNVPLLETLVFNTTTAIEYMYLSTHYFDIHGKREPERNHMLRIILFPNTIWILWLIRFPKAASYHW